MRDAEIDAGQRRTWTPFVGVALAALTAGSLVVFSFVAQRTSLDGFANRGVTALAPSTDAPRSITLPAGGSDTGAATDPPTSTPASLFTVAPTSSVSVAPGESAAPRLVAVAETSTGPVGAAEITPVGSRASFADGGARPTWFLNGETKNADGAKRSVPKDKAKNAKKAKKAKKSKNKSHNKAAFDRKGRGDERRSSGSKPSGHSGGRAAPPAQPARSSRPAARPKPQKAAKPAKPSHWNTKGKGHSKGRGRGHAND